MKKLSKRQKAYQIRRKAGLEKRRVRAIARRKENRLQEIAGEES